MRVPRRFSPRLLAIPILIVVAVLALLTYVDLADYLPDWRRCQPQTASPAAGSVQFSDPAQQQRALKDWERSSSAAYQRSFSEPAATFPFAGCPSVRPSSPQINTMDVYPNLNFQPDYMHRRDYWDSSLDKRYVELKSDKSRPTLKVVVLPHSHVDPGWLKTFEDYYVQSTRSILDNLVVKLTQHRNMTFIWTEISFFSMWWESALPSKRRQIKQLVDEGRLEFTSGTWVMTDEATPHLYSMLDQMIEGHQWLKSRLGVSPKSVWSVDPFGHGPVAPYLLHAAGLQNTVVQRIHYGWKRWLADRQISDFHWQMPFETEGQSILCHNFPFDIYTTKHSCGPDPKTCLAYDFRSIRGEYNEFTLNAVPISKFNLQAKAEVLLDQYAKSGSLSGHNVVLALVGDDFRYDHDIEWDQQYVNYQNLFNFINSNSQRYNRTEIGFGTLTDYFDAVRLRTKEFPSLSGDFFPYSDIFSEGRPAYWTGYYTTRPFYKILAREVESRLRGAEILFTVSLNRARQNDWTTAKRIMDFEYGKLVSARRSLALFQHHDAITGTSKANVMQDYGQKMFQALKNAIDVEARSAALLLSADDQMWQQFRFIPTLQRPSYDRLAQKMTIEMKDSNTQTLVLYNADGHFRHEFVRLKVNWASVRVLDSEGNKVRHQINPVWALFSSYGRSQRSVRRPSSHKLEHIPESFQLVFIAPLAPLSVTSFRIEAVRTGDSDQQDTTLIYCSDCSANASSPGSFQFHPLERADIQVENQKLKLLFDGETGFLKSIRKKASGQSTLCSMQFSAYPSSMFHSGAYLFMPDPNSNEPNIDVLKDEKPQIFIISGPVMSEISVVYHHLVHSTILFHKSGSLLEEAVWMETTLDMGPAPQFREHEFFVRFKTNIRNVNADGKSNATAGAAEFFTDQNGFSMARRVRVSTLGVEANYYPVTSTAYIQDGLQRLSLLFASTHGLTSLNPGWIEFMLDRRTIHDDGRGMGEGVTDNLPTVTPFVLILEDLSASGQAAGQLPVAKPSLLATVASTQLMYPATSFVVDAVEGAPVGAAAPGSRLLFLNQPMPCASHLVALRTLSESVGSVGSVEAELPSSSALMVIHNRGFECSIPAELSRCGLVEEADRVFHAGTSWIGVNLLSVEPTLLTGLESRGSSKAIRLDSIRVLPMELRSFTVTFA